MALGSLPQGSRSTINTTVGRELSDMAHAMIAWYSGGLKPKRLRVAYSPHDDRWELACEHPTESSIYNPATLFVTWGAMDLANHGSEHIMRLACENLGADLALLKYGAWDYMRQIEAYQQTHALPKYITPEERELREQEAQNRLYRNILDKLAASQLPKPDGSDSV